MKSAHALNGKIRSLPLFLITYTLAKMYELYGVNRDTMVYHSPSPEQKEVDILEVKDSFWTRRRLLNDKKNEAILILYNM